METISLVPGLSFKSEAQRGSRPSTAPLASLLPSTSLPREGKLLFCSMMKCTSGQDPGPHRCAMNGAAFFQGLLFLLAQEEGPGSSWTVLSLRMLTKSVGLDVTGKKDSDSCLEGNGKPLWPEDPNVLSTQLSGSLRGNMEETGF